VQDEGEPLRRRQGLEHDEQREPDTLCEQGLLLGIVGVVGAQDRLGQPRAGVLLGTGATRSKRVEADPADDGRQPAAEVVDPFGVGAAQPQPGLLDGVLGLGHRAEHPIGDRTQVGPVTLELLGHPVALVHVTSSRRDPS